MRGAAKVMRAEFRTRHVYHAQMEPLNATVAVSADGKSAEVWAGTQNTAGLVAQVAGVLQTDPGNVKFNQQLLGGGYGRRSQITVVLDAARLSKAPGKPVKLIWSREDDIKHGKFRPSTVQYIEAGLDADGKIVAWHHRVVAESAVRFMIAGRGITPPRTDQIVMKGTPIPMYAIPNKLAEHVVQDGRTRLAPLRGVGNAPNAFAIESFLDEIARRDQQGPAGAAPGADGAVAARATSRTGGGGDVGLDAQARRPRPRHGDHGEGRHARGRRGGGLGGSRQRQDQGPQFLGRDRRRHRGAAGQHRGADRGRHHLGARACAARADHHQERPACSSRTSPTTR